MGLQMKSAVLNPPGLISTFSFVNSFKTALNSKRVHEEAAMRLFQRFMKVFTKSALSQQVCIMEEVDQDKEKHIKYFQTLNYLSSTPATEKVIANAEA